MTTEIEVRVAFANQAEWCERLGSPLTARLMEGLGRSLDRSTRSGARILDWQGQPDAMGDSVPLRLASGLNSLARSGMAEALIKLYPPNSLPKIEKLTRAALETISAFDDIIFAWLDNAPQTNEVARSGVLFPGLMEISARTSQPLDLYEIGASAGLNLFGDRFAYRLPGRDFGDRESRVLLSPDWSGNIPEWAAPVVNIRRGCDLQPIDISSKNDVDRLLSYI